MASEKAMTKLPNLSDIPVGSTKKIFHSIAELVPPIREAKTPAFEKRFQNNSNNTAGPKEDPIPAHAYDTSPYTVSVNQRAMRKATTPMPIIIILFTQSIFFSDLLILDKSWYKSSLMEEEHTIS